MKTDPELLQRRLKAGPTGEKSRRQKVIQLFASLSFFCLMAVPGLDERYNWSQVSVLFTIISEILVATGFFIVFLVFKENTYTSAVIETAENQTVITTGPYSVVRHPMYSGALLMLLFTPLALDSYWGLITFFPILLTIIMRLLDEEKFLAQNLPGYKTYCEKIRYRLVPRIW